MTEPVKIALKVASLSSSKADVGAYALVLQEIGERRRQLPIIIGASEAQAISIEMRGIVTPRPLTYNLFATTLEVMRIKLEEVYIYKVNKGIYYSYLMLRGDDGEPVRIDARTSDAVSLALRLDAPIYIDERILESEYIRPEDYTPDKEGQAPPHRDADQLRQLLQQAVEAENYEEAARLRDELNEVKK